MRLNKIRPSTAGIVAVCIVLLVAVLIGNLVYINREVTHAVAASAHFANKSSLAEITTEIAANNAHQKKLATQLAVKLALSQAKAGIPTCKALRALDNALHGVKFAKKKRTGVPRAKSYGLHLARAIHRVYLSTRCGDLLKRFEKKK